MQKRGRSRFLFLFPLLAVDAGNKSVAKAFSKLVMFGEFFFSLSKSFSPVIVLYEDTTQRYLAIVNNCPGFMTFSAERRGGSGEIASEKWITRLELVSYVHFYVVCMCHDNQNLNRCLTIYCYVNFATKNGRRDGASIKKLTQNED